MHTKTGYTIDRFGALTCSKYGIPLDNTTALLCVRWFATDNTSTARRINRDIEQHEYDPQSPISETVHSLLLDKRGFTKHAFDKLLTTAINDSNMSIVLRPCTGFVLCAKADKQDGDVQIWDREAYYKASMDTRITRKQCYSVALKLSFNAILGMR